MVSKSLAKAGRAVVVASMLAVVSSAGVNADDTEVFQLTPVSTTARPQVLIVFDDSGSMNGLITSPESYDPTDTSYTYDGTNKHPTNRVYWSTDSSPPPANSGDYFLSDRNRCDSSIEPLSSTDPDANKGFFPTKALHWSPDGRVNFCYLNDGVEECVLIPGGSPGWKELSAGGTEPAHVECEVDFINSNPLNPGSSDGFPQNTSTDGLEYGPDEDGSLDWGAGAYFFYSAHYMDWYHQPAPVEVTKSKLEIAQEVMVDLVEVSTGIDFGFALFNYNGDDADNPTDGGRIVQRMIPNMNDGDRTNLTTIVKDTIASGATPLCESTLEVYRYLAGEDVVYGLQRNLDPIDDPNSPLDGLPVDLQPRDLEAEDPPGTYDPPLAACATTYIILMTDGLPFDDTDGNAVIEDLTGETCDSYLSDHPVTEEEPDPLRKNCLPQLTGYMATTDLDGDASNGEQLAFTYTIGFGLSDDEPLLSDAASMGNGAYYAADNAESLAAALRGVILEIESEQLTFTSPAAAVDTFTRTESRDEVFFSMFQPGSKVNWPGNIKRLDFDLSTGEAVLVDQDRDPTNPALTLSGQIRASATTFWSTTDGDGPTVTEGGVGGLLKARDPATRDVYSNTGSSEALQPFGPDTMTPAAFGQDNDGALYAIFGVDDEAEFNAALRWGAGFDVADEDEDGVTNEARWILSDMLHSKPLVVNYGARPGYTAENPDLRVVVGTNSGFLHMFRNIDGEEAWAFFAKELAPVLNKRRVNEFSSEHVYGIDSTPVLYTEDLDRDGTIELTGDDATSDKAYLYFGLRRGGRGLYALDISNPDLPEMLWRIDHFMPGYEELGQTWSEPVVTRIPGYENDEGISQPVLIFGAGYDDSKDSYGLAAPDAIGRGIFIVDAATGELVWSMTPAANSDTNMEEPGLLHSVAGSVTVLDSNGDTLTDRIYFGDTGGQLWRVDLPGATLPDDSQDTWRAVKMAEFNEGTAATDRRFFNAPDVVRTRYVDATFDAILIGSGDRTNPNDLGDPNDPTIPAVDNQFYMIRDRATSPYFTALEPCSDDSVDFRCDLPLTPADLYDVTSNVIQNGSVEEQNAAQEALAIANGWRLDLTADGEKALSRSLTIEGTVYFSTFFPNAAPANVCEPASGSGRLYAINLLNATSERGDDPDDDVERFWTTTVIVPPDTPTPHFGSDGEIRLLLPTGTSDGSVSSPLNTGVSIPRPHASYWYREEY